MVYYSLADDHVIKLMEVAKNTKKNVRGAALCRKLAFN